MPEAPVPDLLPWWRTAVVYQVYLRSFADGDGDGIGDLTGLRARLTSLAELGVDALWLNPWYPSPMADAGYDVSDYRDIDPLFGTLEQAQAFLDEAHALGMRVILDIVPNHSSDQHPWFTEAVAAEPGSPARQRFHFRPGRGPDGAEPPNNWRSRFGGPAWTRLTDPDGTPGEWYLHLFAPEQPDLNWQHPDVRAEFESVLRFWFDRGVDGLRIDVAHSLIKDPALPDLAPGVRDGHNLDRVDHPYQDRDEVHDIYREWRRIADSYDPPRIFVGEAWIKPQERLARYVRSDELHTVFNFDFLTAPWNADALRAVIDESHHELTAVGAPATWVLSNHDVVRPPTRYAPLRQDRPARWLQDVDLADADPERGNRRARAAALLMLGLPGGAYIYQGEELGLAEVTDLPEDALQDPTWQRSGHTGQVRDGCRVPLPWSGAEPPYGFSADSATAPPWLPQPLAWKGNTAEDQDSDPNSMRRLYRDALRLRREHPGFTTDDLRWRDAPNGVLFFQRVPSTPDGSADTSAEPVSCVVNLSGRPFPLPGGCTPLLTSGPLADGVLPDDTAAWLTGHID